jgi:MoaA/NifB/PqqE/SkfB family radical SAM enzyme
MMLSVSTNGSRLSSLNILDLLSARRPYRLTVSVYGASEQTYDAVTRRRGSFRAFSKGLAAAHEAGLPLNLNIIVVKQNAHETGQMTALAEGLDMPHVVYSNISPTIYGGPESLPAQSVEHLRRRKPFTGCNADQPARAAPSPETALANRRRRMEPARLRPHPRHTARRLHTRIGGPARRRPGPRAGRSPQKSR